MHVTGDGVDKKKGETVERRSGRDRRKDSNGDYKGPERRRQLEPRKPQVQELDVSESEWARLFEDFSKSREKG